MKIKFTKAKYSLHFLITFSELHSISIEVFNLNFLRDVLKGKMKPIYKDRRISARLKPHSGRKKTQLKTVKMYRFFNIFIKHVKTKDMKKYFYRKILKKLGYV